MKFSAVRFACYIFLLTGAFFIGSCASEPPIETWDNTDSSSSKIEKVESGVIRVRKPASDELAIARGKELAAGCFSCHAICGKLIGPELKGARQRWNNDAKLYDFTMHPEKYLGKDPYVKRLQEESSGAVMAVSELTLEEVRNIYTYLDTVPCD